MLYYILVHKFELNIWVFRELWKLYYGNICAFSKKSFLKRKELQRKENTLNMKTVNQILGISIGTL